MSHTARSTLRSSFVVFSLLVALLGTPLSGAAQDVASVVENMREVYQQQLETVETYIVETNMYTSYARKVNRNGEPTYETSTQMQGQGSSALASTSTPSSVYGFEFDRLKQQATYGGTETINGTQTHILQVDNPSEVYDDVGEEAESMSYYIDAERHVPVRMVMQMASDENPQDSRQGGSMTVNLKNYQTVDDLTLPHRMELQVDANMSEEQQRQMEQLKKQLEDMPEEQRKQMEQMMGDGLEMMQNMMSGEPMVVEVQRVQVNVDLPPEAFSSSNDSQ